MVCVERERVSGWVRGAGETKASNAVHLLALEWLCYVGAHCVNAQIVSGSQLTPSIAARYIIRT